MKTPQHDCVLISPVGKLGLTIAKNKLIKVQFLSPKAKNTSAQNSVARKIVAQINKYFCNPKVQFGFSIQVTGTPLQQKIWQAIQKIPSGKITTYGELARKIGTSPRVVGNACRRNPLPIVIPCHRVIAISGFGGYCGNVHQDALKNKKWLLRHEGMGYK